MSVQRTYRPDECSADGIPLDWDRCRLCGGNGALRGTEPPTGICGDCGGHGSLKAAVLAELTPKWDWSKSEPLIARCASCSHPMSEGTWEPKLSESQANAGTPTMLAYGLIHLRRGGSTGEPHEPPGPVHYSACDLLCDHGGPVDYEAEYGWEVARVPADGRLLAPSEVAADYLVRASWRPVDIRVGMVAKRTLGDRFDPSKVLQVRPFDLTPGNVAVMCLRCWATS